MFKIFIYRWKYGKNVIFFGAKNKDILIVCEGLIQGSDNTKLTAEAKYLIDLTQPNKRLHYNGSNGFLLVNTTEIY